MSPPWGGPDYSKVTKFDINSMLRPRDGYCSFFGGYLTLVASCVFLNIGADIILVYIRKSLFDAGKRIAPKIVMFLPRNVDINQLAELSLSAVPPWSLEVPFILLYILIV